MSLKKIKITRYADGGHSWFKMDRKKLLDLGIENDISGCSYQLGNNVYLEEDCDISVYFKAFMKTKNIEEFSWTDLQNYFSIDSKHTNKRSKIRNYERYEK